MPFKALKEYNFIELNNLMTKFDIRSSLDSAQLYMPLSLDPFSRIFIIHRM